MRTGETNKKYYEGYEEYDYIAFKIKEKQDTVLVLWDGYIDSMLENQKEWESGLSLDWCEESGPYELRDEDACEEVFVVEEKSCSGKFKTTCRIEEQ